MITYIIFISSIVLFILSIVLFKKTHSINLINSEINNINKQLEENNKKLERRKNLLEKDVEFKEKTIKDKRDVLNNLQNNIDKTLKNQIQLSQEAFKNYFNSLEQQYKETEEEYEQFTDTLKTAYSNLQLKLMREADECRKDLDKMRATRAAAQEAQRKEEEIKANSSFYCIQLTKEEKEDIARLEKVKLDLHKPRVLSMLIWSSIFQPKLKQLSIKVLGSSSTVCGIYKITNVLNNKCYIGQAVDVRKRWSEHAKAGLGIDTPANNKLYQAMIEDGLWNFSWELLEECSREELNEKEKFYIDLYDSKNWGYNTLSGIRKGVR